MALEVIIGSFFCIGYNSLFGFNLRGDVLGIFLQILNIDIMIKFETHTLQKVTLWVNVLYCW